MLKDLRHGIRVLLQAKGWTAVVVLSLAVGIGANAAIFTALNGLMLRKLPVTDPDSLVSLDGPARTRWSNDSSDYGISDAADRRRAGAGDVLVPDVRAFPVREPDDDRSGRQPAEGGITVTIDGRAETASALLATGNYTGCWASTPALDARSLPDDDKPVGASGRDAQPSLLAIAFRGRSSDVIGKTILVNTIPVTIVGVASADFSGTQLVTAQSAGLLLPIKFDDHVEFRRSAAHRRDELVGAGDGAAETRYSTPNR